MCSITSHQNTNLKAKHKLLSLPYTVWKNKKSIVVIKHTIYFMKTYYGIEQSLRGSLFDLYYLAQQKLRYEIVKN